MSDYILSEGFEEAERGAIVALLSEYEHQIGVSLDFQDFAAELAGLPGAYAPPGGTLILARGPNGAALAGCVALRPVATAAHQCEMKRLYVRAEARTSGLGRRLALAAIAAGGRLGYQTICLDTLPSMRAAQALYASLGFRRVGIGGGRPPVILFERAL
ncbi:MAG TPA: GNAT family N-acetyltransferase [Hyphomicrobiaceae bacterium]|nr:GNAT family N-acetyltransferase [Hyphomicrobiaceae bacterium]